MSKLKSILVLKGKIEKKKRKKRFIAF